MLSYIGFSLKDIVCLKRIDFNDILSHLPQCIIYVKLYGKKCPLHISCFFQRFLSFKINMLKSMAIFYMNLCVTMRKTIQKPSGRGWGEANISWMTFRIWKIDKFLFIDQNEEVPSSDDVSMYSCLSLINMEARDHDNLLILYIHWLCLHLLSILF